MSALTTTVPSRLPVVATGSLQSYIDTVQRIPLLDREEEIALFTRFQEEGDLEAARTIVMAHLRYVVFVAMSYRGYGLPVEDLIQQGNIGLMKSVKRFELQHGVRLVTFAMHWIKAEIHEYILKNWRMVKVATTKAQRKLFFNLRKRRKSLGWMSGDEVAQIAIDLGVNPADVVEMESRLSGHDESFDPVVLEGDEGDSNFAPSGYLTHGTTEDPGVVLAEAEWEEDYTAGLAVALERLDERSRDIIRSRWLGDEKVGLKELAVKYGISIERVRQIEAKALEKIRGVLVA